MTEKSFLENIRYYPMLVMRDSLGKEISMRTSVDLWGIFRNLPEETKDILTAPEMSQRIERLQKERGLSDDLIEIISAIIREYFVLKKDSLWLENALLAKLERKDVSFVKEYIQKNIFTIKPVPKALEEGDSVPSLQTASLPLLDALAKYQRLSEQTVTEDRIVVKGESAPVRASIRNWLRNYRDNVGIRKHSTVERGQFLFQSENTKRLPAAEREKLSLILRSLDENALLSIDVERQEVIFPAFEEKGAVAPVPQEGNAVPTLGTSFRPLGKFPAQAAPLRKALEWNAGEAGKAPSAGVLPLKSPFSSGSPGGNMSFSSSHVLPGERPSERSAERPQESARETLGETLKPQVPRSPEAISIITPRDNRLGFRGGAGSSDGSMPDGGFDAPRVVDLRSQKGG